jgi:hypothetical protein
MRLVLIDAKLGVYTITLLRKTNFWNDGAKSSVSADWYGSDQNAHPHLLSLSGKDKPVVLRHVEEKVEVKVTVSKENPEPTIQAFIPKFFLCDAHLTTQGWVQVLSYQGPQDAKPVVLNEAPAKLESYDR